MLAFRSCSVALCLSVVAALAGAQTPPKDPFDKYSFQRNESYYLRIANTPADASNPKYLTAASFPGNTPGLQPGYKWSSSRSNALEIVFLPVAYSANGNSNTFLLFDVTGPSLLYGISAAAAAAGFPTRLSRETEFARLDNLEEQHLDLVSYVFTIDYIAQNSTLKISNSDVSGNIRYISDGSGGKADLVSHDSQEIAYIAAEPASSVDVPDLPSSSELGAPPPLSTCETSSYNSGVKALVDTALVPWFFAKDPQVTTLSQAKDNMYYYIKRYSQHFVVPDLSLDNWRNAGKRDLIYTIGKGFSEAESRSMTQTFGFSLTYGFEASATFMGAGVKESFSLGLSYDLSMTSSVSDSMSEQVTHEWEFHADPCVTTASLGKKDTFELTDKNGNGVASWDTGVVSSTDVHSESFPNWCHPKDGGCPTTCPQYVPNRCLLPDGQPTTAN